MDPLGGRRSDRPLGAPVGRLALVKLCESGMAAGVEHPAVGPPGRALLLEGIEVAADRRFRHPQLAHEIVERGKAAHTDEIDQTAASLTSLHARNLPQGGRSMVEGDHKSIQKWSGNDHASISNDGFRSVFRQEPPLNLLKSADGGVCAGCVEE